MKYKPLETLIKIFVTFSKIALLAVACFALLVSLVVYSNRRRNETYLLPDHFHGWVQIAYGMKGQPPLPIEHGAYLLDFTHSSSIKTSTPFEAGWAHCNYDFLREGKRVELDKILVGFGYNSSANTYAGDGSIVSKGPETLAQFFGTKAEFDKHPRASKWDAASENFKEN